MVFLTNKQAGLVAGNLRSIKLLFEFLETPDPKLVINLLHSQGTVADTLGRCTNGLAKMDEYLEDGRVRGVHPWASLDEAMRAEQKLDAFMESVLIPIAEKNNAVVICECLEGDCFLSASFNRVMAMQASRHAGPPLITVIAFSCDLESLYRNGDPNAKWRRMRSKSHHWKVREKGEHGLLKLKERQNYFHYKHYGSADLDMSAANFIIVDGIDVKTGKWDRRQAFNQLKVEMVRYLTASASEGGKGLPSVAFKTGYSARISLEKAGANSSGLRNAVACLESGQSLIFIDLREHALPNSQLDEESKKSSFKLPEYVLQSYSENCKALFSNQDGVRCDYFDVMAAAYCWLALHNTSDSQNKLERPRFLPLCEALRLEMARAVGGRGQQGSYRYRKVVTPSEVQELAWLLANKLVKDAFEVYWHYVICDAKNLHREYIGFGAHHIRVTWGMGDYLPGGNKDLHAKSCKGDTFDCKCIKDEMLKRYLAKHMETRVKATAASLSKIWGHDKFHGCSIADVEGSKRLVETLVKQDRLPLFEGLEGLELLQRAWNEYDVTVHLAVQYKRYSLFFYAFYLVLGVAVVVVTVIASERTSQDFVSFEDSLNISRTFYLEDESLKEWLSHTIFGLSLAASLVLSFQSYLNPTQRAEQLHSSAASLESITWLYRTKVGPFERGSHTFSLGPERALLQALKAWNSELVAGTDLEHTDLKKKFPAKVFKHFQYQCAESHPRRKKSELQHTRIEALELQISILLEHTELKFIPEAPQSPWKRPNLVMDVGKSLLSHLNCCTSFKGKSKSNIAVKKYEDLLVKGALYRREKDWKNAARAYREAIALYKKEGEPKFFAEFRLGEVHMHLGEEKPTLFYNLAKYFNLEPIPHYMKAAHRFREVERFFREEEARKRKQAQASEEAVKTRTQEAAMAKSKETETQNQRKIRRTRLLWRDLGAKLYSKSAATARLRLAAKSQSARLLAATHARISGTAHAKLATDKRNPAATRMLGISVDAESAEAEAQAANKLTLTVREDVQDMKADEQIKLDSFDDHQSPVAWEAYLKLRVHLAIENYNKRIPNLLRWKNAWQVFLFLLSALGAALSYSSLTPYVAMVSAAAAAVSAWIAFGQQSARLVRYTKTVRQLEQLLAWWSAQSDAEKSAKINELVTTAELIITSERQAWQTLEQTAEESNENTLAERKKPGVKARSETPRNETGRSDTGLADIETGQ